MEIFVYCQDIGMKMKNGITKLSAPATSTRTKACQDTKTQWFMH